MFPRFEVKVLPKIKEYLKDNPGAPFVIGFQLLLVVCAGLLIQGMSATANEIATYAYFLLVIGGVLQFFAYVKHRNETEEKDVDG